LSGSTGTVSQGLGKVQEFLTLTRKDDLATRKTRESRSSEDPERSLGQGKKMIISLKKLG